MDESALLHTKVINVRGEKLIYFDHSKSVKWLKFRKCDMHRISGKNESSWFSVFVVAEFLRSEGFKKIS